MKLVPIALAVMALMATPVIADPQPKADHQGCVAQATLAYKASGYPAGSTGQVISDRNTNPDNTLLCRQRLHEPR